MRQRTLGRGEERGVAALSQASDLLFDEERRATAGMRPAAFGLAWTRGDLFIGLAAVIGVVGAAVLVAEGGAASDPTAFTAVLVANIATLAVAGMLWRSTRPSSRIGTLLLLEGLLVAVSSLAGSRNPAVHVIGFLAGWAAFVGVFWLIAAFPRACPRGVGGWAVVWLALAVFVFGELPFLLMSSNVPIVSAIGECAGACPANPIQLVNAPEARAAFGDVESVLQSIAAVALLAYMAVQFLQASRPRRRKLAFVYAAIAPFVVAFAVTSVLAGLGDVSPGHGARGAFVATRIVAPLGFVGALLYARSYAAVALGYMSARLVGEPSLATVEQLVRSVLDDPLARLAFWLPGLQKFVDRHGRTVDPGGDSRDVSWWSLQHDGDPTLTIVHDSALDDDPELLEAVGLATTLALENRRLHHDLVGTVHALHASQKRLVNAASEERRRLERDLHDGVQQRLVALRIHLDLARRHVEGESGLKSELADFGEQLDEALRDLRALAHGIFPPLLAEEGLGAALREVARRSAVPVAVRIDDPGRLKPACESAVYYCCLEALQNVAKHAGEDAVATLRVWHDARTVHFSVVDDGGGFVRDPDAGNFGLTNMSDRIGAVDGSLSVRSRPGEGTKVEGRIPIASAVAASGVS